MRLVSLFAILVMVLSLSPNLALADDPVAVAVMDFSSKGGVTQEQMDALGDMLANNIRSAGNYKVIGKSDIRAALNMETQKQLLGCNDESCIAEIGGALGVRWVVLGNISQFGDLFLLNLKLLDVDKVTVLQGVSKKIDGGQAALIDALPVAAAELMKAAEKSMGMVAKTTTVDKPKDTPVDTPKDTTVDKPKDTTVDKPKDTTVDKPKDTINLGSGSMTEVGTTAPARERSSYNLWGHITLWSGVAALGASGAFFAVSKKKANDYFDEDIIEAANASRQWAGMAWGALGLGVALAATGVTLWILEPDEPGIAATISPTPDGGAMLGIGGRW